MGDGRIPGLRAFAARVAGASGLENGTTTLTKRCKRICNCWRIVLRRKECRRRTLRRRRQFGNTTMLREDRRELRTLVYVKDLGRDVRYTLRSLRRSRAFAAVTIATLGLGIGASTAIFSVIDNVLLEPFP
jgi:hypothetical protein